MKELKEEMLAGLRRKVNNMLAIDADLVAKAERTMDVQHMHILVFTRMIESHGSRPARHSSMQMLHIHCTSQIRFPPSTTCTEQLSDSQTGTIMMYQVQAGASPQ